MKRKYYLGWMSTAGILMTLLVIFGAFGAHALKSQISESAMGTFETAVRYGFIHALALLITNAIGLQLELRTRWTNAAFCAGLILFSAALMLHSCRGLLGMPGLSLAFLAPLGGLSFIVGWILFTLNVRNA